MWAQWFKDQPIVSVALVAMAIFVGAFLVVVLRALRSDKSTLDERAQLPLLSDQGEIRG